MTFFAPVSDEPVLLDGRLEIVDAEAVALGLRRAALSSGAFRAMRRGHERMRACVAEGRVVQGLTDGPRPFTPPAPLTAETPRMGWAGARAATLARLASLSRGWSGASPLLADAMARLLNGALAPALPDPAGADGAGANPLAHLAAALTGAGGFLDRRGSAVETDDAMAAMGMRPWTPEGRDAQALAAGPAVATGLGVLNAAAFARLIGWSEALTVLLAELNATGTEGWDDAYARARAHPGLAAAAAALRGRARDAGRLKPRPLAWGPAPDGPAARDPQALAAAPHALGAARDAGAFHDAVVLRELNGAADDPLIPEDGPPALHGAGCADDHLTLAAQTLCAATLTMTRLTAAQLALVPGLEAAGAEARLQAMRARAAAAQGAPAAVAAAAAAAQLSDAFALTAALGAAATLAMRGAGGAAGFGASSRATAAWIGRLAPTLGADGGAAQLRAVAAAMARTRPPL
jgi:tyrosine ammonia-lyase